LSFLENNIYVVFFKTITNNFYPGNTSFLFQDNSLNKGTFYSLLTFNTTDYDLINQIILIPEFINQNSTMTINNNNIFNNKKEFPFDNLAIPYQFSSDGNSQQNSLLPVNFEFISLDQNGNNLMYSNYKN